jgi:hypothetical protein
MASVVSNGRAGVGRGATVVGAPVVVVGAAAVEVVEGRIAERVTVASAGDSSTTAKPSLGQSATVVTTRATKSTAMTAISQSI